jgi:putative hydrolase of the HAD superfamily
MKITTIFFDFVGVLLELNKSCVVSPQVEMIDRQIGKVIDDRQFRESVIKDYGLSEMQFDTVLEQVVDRYQPFEPLWNLLPELRKKYSLGIINNGTWLTYPRFNARYGIDQRFDSFISSAVEGVRKPDSRIFLRACEKLHASPNQCLFLDDSQENVSGANQAGMHGMWWETHPSGIEAFISWMASTDGKGS